MTDTHLHAVIAEPEAERIDSALQSMGVVRATVVSALDRLDVTLTDDPADILFISTRWAQRDQAARLRQLRQDFPDLPIVITAAAREEELALQLLDDDADDYLLLDQIDARAVAHVIRNARRYRTTRAELKTHQSETRQRDEREQVSRYTNDVICNGLEQAFANWKGAAGSPAGAESVRRAMQDVADFARWNGEGVRSHRSFCSVESIASDVLLDIGEAALRRGVDMTADIAPNVPTVYCDREAIQSAWTALIQHSIDSTPRGRILVWARHDEKNRGVLFGVTDNGNGLADHELASILARVPQIAQPSGSQSHVLRLHLAVKRIELNLGEVAINTRAGDGGSKSFRLPMADPESLLSRYVRRQAEHKDPDDRVALVQGVVDDCEPMPTWADAWANCVQDQLAPHDFFFPLTPTSYLLAIAGGRDPGDSTCARLRSAWREFSIGVPRDLKFRTSSFGEWSVEGQFNELLAYVQTVLDLAELR
ncbi:MAG: ATP-binding protein, partial [Pirellulaceae bacterium]|nr:ATP-binding protein [Pirellulaceae bacterium]